MTALIEKLAWTPIRNRAILFARSRHKKLFYAVGGKREPGEDDLTALLREIEEETGAKLMPDTIRHVHTFVGEADGAPKGTGPTNICYDGVPDREPVPLSEIEELAWLTTADMARTTLMGRQILQWFHDQSLID